MRARALGIAFAITAALNACGGRAEFSRAGEGTSGVGGSTDLAGTSGSQPNSGNGGSASDRAGRAGDGAGAGAGGIGAGASAGATGDADAGASNLGGSRNLGGGAGAGAGGACASEASRFASEVLDHSFGEGQNTNQTTGFPSVLFGPPVANNPNAVVSLGNGGWLVLGFSGNAIVNGPGVDFTVFENPLFAFKELATVAVSEDAEHWVEFPCTAARDATDYGFCAGVHVVYSSPSNGIDPLDPAVSGGDHYDLADIGVSHARFVRITDRGDLTGNAGVFDLDAVAIVNGELVPDCSP